MNKETDYRAIRKLATAFLDLPVKEDERFQLFIDHPFIQNRYGMADGQPIDLLADREALRGALESVQKLIDEVKDEDLVARILALLAKPYRFAWLDFSSDYQSAKDLGYTLEYIWTQSEFQTSNPQLKKKELIKLFKKADKKYLFHEPKESLPEEVTVYKGYRDESSKDGMSWTLDEETAKWFANRFGNDGYAIKGTLNRDDVLAWFADSNENEIVCDPKKVKDTTIMEVPYGEG